ncbi:nucleotidyltransferase domain-containing protein [Acidianus manzaensis]|uniref:DNA polymerase subunit beta n=1 Tax=Acidianus manzaensis TaxID=282676 RepID=A0A1W6K2Z4_9CREN|nr:nucleotidyltransferase domain-containing protein [Acidianus manzaensis]ARM76814.1 DNA polymerase subunit beta [Acidianus manzaensis]
MGKGKSAIESQKKMIDLAKNIVLKIAKDLPLTEVYIFGSRARCDYLDSSDIDLVFVLRGIKKLTVFERMNMISKYISGRVDYIVLDEEEKDRLPKDSKLFWNIRNGFIEKDYDK